MKKAGIFFLLSSTLPAKAQNKPWPYIQIPPGYEQPILAALAQYPQLKDTHIEFRVKKNFSPFETRPRTFHVFKKASRRQYIITISNHTSDTLRHLLWQNLDDSARTGVIGHELAHVADFMHLNTWQCMGMAICHLSQRYLDRFEYHTDMIALEHGMGPWLYYYRRHIFKVYQLKYWRGVDHYKRPNHHFERYMNPETILKWMKTHSPLN